MSALRTFFALLGSLALASCNRGETGAENAVAPETSILEFHTKGLVKRVDEGGVLTVEHEEMPGYMAAMTMPFEVKNKNDIEGINVGDEITFKYTVTSEDSWIDNIKLLRSSSYDSKGVKKNKPAPPGAGNNYFTIGDTIEDFNFLSHKNETTKLSDFRGKVIVITFIYTRCPVPNFCPRLSLRFKSALDILSADTLNQSAYHFLSITFDPEYDTPEMLTQYATSYKSNDHKNWTFLTPGAAESDDFSRKVGVVVTRDEKNNLSWDHNLRTLIIDRSGKIKTILVGNLWSAEELVNEVKSLF